MLACFEKAILCHSETSVSCAAPKRHLNSFRPAGEATEINRDAEAKHTHCNPNTRLHRRRPEGWSLAKRGLARRVAASWRQSVLSGSPVAQTFVVTSRWPSLSRVSGRQDLSSLPDVQQFLWIVALKEKIPADVFVFGIFRGKLAIRKVEESYAKAELH